MALKFLAVVLMLSHLVTASFNRCLHDMSIVDRSGESMSLLQFARRDDPKLSLLTKADCTRAKCQPRTSPSPLTSTTISPQAAAAAQAFQVSTTALVPLLPNTTITAGTAVRVRRGSATASVATTTETYAPSTTGAPTSPSAPDATETADKKVFTTAAMTPRIAATASVEAQGASTTALSNKAITTTKTEATTSLQGTLTNVTTTATAGDTEASTAATLALTTTTAAESQYASTAASDASAALASSTATADVISPRSTATTSASETLSASTTALEIMSTTDRQPTTTWAPTTLEAPPTAASTVPSAATTTPKLRNTIAQTTKAETGARATEVAISLQPLSLSATTTVFEDTADVTDAPVTLATSTTAAVERQRVSTAASTTKAQADTAGTTDALAAPTSAAITQSPTSAPTTTAAEAVTAEATSTSTTALPITTATELATRDQTGTQGTTLAAESLRTAPASDTTTTIAWDAEVSAAATVTLPTTTATAAEIRMAPTTASADTAKRDATGTETLASRRDTSASATTTAMFALDAEASTTATLATRASTPTAKTESYTSTVASLPVSVNDPEELLHSTTATTTKTMRTRFKIDPMAVCTGVSCQDICRSGNVLRFHETRIAASNLAGLHGGHASLVFQNVTYQGGRQVNLVVTDASTLFPDAMVYGKRSCQERCPSRFACKYKDKFFGYLPECDFLDSNTGIYKNGTGAARIAIEQAGRYAFLFKFVFDDDGTPAVLDGLLPLVFYDMDRTEAVTVCGAKGRMMNVFTHLKVSETADCMTFTSGDVDADSPADFDSLTIQQKVSSAGAVFAGASQFMASFELRKRTHRWFLFKSSLAMLGCEMASW